MTIETSGLHELIRTFDRMSRPMSHEQMALIESLFARTATEADAHVHVVTGALKASGEMTTGTDGSSTWWETRYTDRAAKYELARGGSHYFLDPFNEAEQEYEETAMAILEAMTRD